MRNKSRVESRESRAKVFSPKSKVQSPKFQERGKNAPLAAHRSSLIFGVLPVLESLRAGGRRIEKILIADGARERRLNEVLDLAREKGIPFEKTARADFSRYVEPEANHQGVIAFAAAAEYADAEELLNEIAARENSLSIVLDGVEDPRNFGAILRTAECAGVAGVFIPERRAVGLTEIVAKTSAGATEYVKIAKVTNISRLLEELKERGIWTIGTSMDAEKNYTDWDWTQKNALILGGEGRGLHRLVAEKCDALVKIPMLGRIESLNVSVAAGVILYEAVRQQNKKMENGE
ncbi:MAG: 23S rRNA (guanosine(2251)-2'-O)-methyltransferase RlmB [Pyrinomonadaceae bacterium]